VKDFSNSQRKSGWEREPPEGFVEEMQDLAVSRLKKAEDEKGESEMYLGRGGR